MVRGRRVRPLVASAKNAPVCDSPKRKDQRLEFTRKIIQIPSNIKSQSITDFFQVVHDDSNTDDKTDADKVIIQTFQITEELPVPDTILISDASDDYKSQPTNTTPHRIELCADTQGSPTSALSQLHIAALNAKKGQQPKAKRKLNVNATNPSLHSITDEPIAKLPVPTNHTLTDFFPVRRSVRKTKSTVLEEKQRTLEQCVRNEIEEGLEVKSFLEKGRGIVASQPFSKGDFVVEYRGELIDMAEAKRRELKYAQDKNTGCYMYYFQHKNKQYCVDATAESGYLGRLVNHSRNGNLITRTCSVDGYPRLVLIAKDDIMAGDEVTYDYGDRSKQSLKYHPWLAS